MTLLRLLFCAAAIVASLTGLVLLSQATAGVGIIAFGILMAIFARIVQASATHIREYSKLEDAVLQLRLLREDIETLTKAVKKDQ